MAPTNRKPGGWVLPGHRYLGPFNPIDNGEPVNAADAAARRHDLKYDQYLKEGKNPYLYFNKADSDFLEDLESDRSFGGWIGKGVFGLKRAIAPALDESSGKQNTGGPSAAKKPRVDPVRAQKRKLYFARQAKEAKKQKMSSGGDPSEDTGAGDGEQGGESSAMAGRSGGGAGGGGGGGGGGGSVGFSTGGWEGGTYFSDHTVTTTNTRQWYTGILNGHRYSKLAQPSVGDNATPPWVGIQTPWAYLNVNCYHCHFSPQDWQRLLNEYKAWRPKRMHIRIYNLQIKQITTMGADTLYQNDLTAGVHIFCDGSHQYPYAQHPWDEGASPELPNEIWKLPQYAYFQYQGDLTDHTTNQTAQNVERMLRSNVPLFLLENSNHEVLRTGEMTEFTFSFQSGWVTNDRAYCCPQADFNPLVETRRYYPTWNASNNSYSYTRYGPYKKPSNWMPGPGLAYKGATHTNQKPNDARGPIVTTIAPLGTISNGSTPSNEAPNDGENAISADGVRQSGWQTGPVNGACARTDYPTLAFDPSDRSSNNNIPTRNLDIDMTRWYRVHEPVRSTSGGSTYYNEDDVWMYPNQAWNSTPICRDNPIWDKVPRTDRQTLLDSSDGTLPMHHPPGNIFIKCAKIPIPTSNNSDSYLNIYVTGQVTYTVEWEVQRYQTKNWRPELRTTAGSYNQHEIYNIGDNGVYNRANTFNECMPTKCGINRVL